MHALAFVLPVLWQTHKGGCACVGETDRDWNPFFKSSTPAKRKEPGHDLCSLTRFYLMFIKGRVSGDVENVIKVKK